MSEPLFIGSGTSSNHGSSQGIIPRFYLQMIDIGRFAFDDKKGFDERLESFSNNNMSDFTNFYDIFQEIKKIYSDYIEGLKNGKYYSVDEKGFFKHDQSQELILKQKIKDFFISGRLLVNNFAKSKIIDDNKIIIKDLLIVNDKSFNKNKENFLEIKEGISYMILFQIIEDARKEFLKVFNRIRDDFEHNNLQIKNFEVKKEGELIIIKEPTFGYYKMFEEIEIFYERILGLIELLMVFYFGLKANERTRGNITLFQRKEYDYPSLRYKYTILHRLFADSSLILLIN